MTKLSIVLPSPVIDALTEESLASILQNRPEECEINVVTGANYCDPYDLGDEVNFYVVPGETSILELANIGAEESQSDIMYLMMPGVLVNEGWARTASRRFDNPQIGSVVPLVRSSNETSSQYQIGVSLSSGGRRLPITCSSRATHKQLRSVAVEGPSWRTGFYRRDVFVACNGFDETMGLGHADLDLALTMRRLGFDSVIEPDCQIVDTGTTVTGSEHNDAVIEAAERLLQRATYLTPESISVWGSRIDAMRQVFSHLSSGSLLSYLRARKNSRTTSDTENVTLPRLRNAREYLALLERRATTLHVDDYNPAKRSSSSPTHATMKRRAA